MNDAGHTKLCQCNACADRRLAEFLDRTSAFSKENHVQPTRPDQTVAVKSFVVRAHWRRNARHMNADPALRERVDAMFRKKFTSNKKPRGST